jgi:hypothetical protein
MEQDPITETEDRQPEYCREENCAGGTKGKGESPKKHSQAVCTFGATDPYQLVVRPSESCEVRGSYRRIRVDTPLKTSSSVAQSSDF